MDVKTVSKAIVSVENDTFSEVFSLYLTFFLHEAKTNNKPKTIKQITKKEHLGKVALFLF